MADVTLPQLGETVTEGTITQWFKKVGDTVAADEPLFEVSTDKVDTEVPSPVAGMLTEIRVAEGETVAVGTVIAVVGDGGARRAADAPPPSRARGRGAAPQPEPAPSAEPARRARARAGAGRRGRAGAAPPSRAGAGAEPAPAAEPPPAPAAAAPAPTPPRRPAPAPADNRLLSPVVRRLVNEHGLDPARSPAPARAGASPATTCSTTSTPPAPRPRAGGRGARRRRRPPRLRPRRLPRRAGRAAPRAGARRRAGARGRARRARHDGHAVEDPQAHRRPHGDEQGRQPARVQRRRGRLRQRRRAPAATVKDEWKATEGFSLTYLPFISRAVIDALAEFPHLNASVGDDELVVHDYVDLGIAVDLDYEGLLAPVIRDAETKRLRAHRPRDQRPRHPGPQRAS